MLGSSVMEGHWGATGGGNVRACWDEARRWGTGATGVGFWGSDRMSKLPLILCALHPGFSIEGPSQAKIECDDKGDGSCDVRYWPTEPGEYAVHVICDDEDIRDSPFIAHIQPAPPDCFPDKVRS